MPRLAPSRRGGCTTAKSSAEASSPPWSWRSWGYSPWSPYRFSINSEMSWLLEAAGFKVDWQIGEDNWMSGGVTDVHLQAASILAAQFA